MSGTLTTGLAGVGVAEVRAGGSLMRYPLKSKPHDVMNNRVRDNAYTSPMWLDG
jgi:hypothetical protein